MGLKSTSAHDKTEAAAFATTHWSVVLRASEVDSSEAQNALGQLYQTYWYPLYVYIRRQGHDAMVAQDAIQEMFFTLLEKKQLASVSPRNGRFRSYLLASANHLLANEWHKRQRQKRGSGQTPVALDSLAAENRYQLEPADGRTPEKLFERNWALALLERVFNLLAEEWRLAGKGEMFDALRVFLSDDTDTPHYAEVGRELGLSDGAARVAVHRLRQRYRDLLRAEVAQTVSEPGDIEDELRHLVTVLRS